MIFVKLNDNSETILYLKNILQMNRNQRISVISIFSTIAHDSLVARIHLFRIKDFEKMFPNHCSYSW